MPGVGGSGARAEGCSTQHGGAGSYRTTTMMMYKKKNHTTTNLAELVVLAQDEVHELFVLNQDDAHELLVHVMGRRRGEQR